MLQTTKRLPRLPLRLRSRTRLVRSCASRTWRRHVQRLQRLLADDAVDRQPVPRLEAADRRPRHRNRRRRRRRRWRRDRRTAVRRWRSADDCRMAAAEPQAVGLRHLRPAAAGDDALVAARSPARCAGPLRATASAATPSASGWCASRNRSPGRSRCAGSGRSAPAAQRPGPKRLAGRRGRRRRRPRRPQECAPAEDGCRSGDRSWRPRKSPKPRIPCRNEPLPDGQRPRAASSRTSNLWHRVGGPLGDFVTRPTGAQTHQAPGGRMPGGLVAAEDGGLEEPRQRVLRAGRGSGRSRTARAGAATCSGSRTRRR